jgi:hypothetical protein
MKILSDAVVSKEEVTALDEKQSRQIRQLKVMLGVSFVLNIALTLGLKFLM